jgi:hypothetical protein
MAGIDVEVLDDLAARSGRECLSSSAGRSSRSVHVAAAHQRVRHGRVVVVRRADRVRYGSPMLNSLIGTPVTSERPLRACFGPG